MGNWGRLGYESISFPYDVEPGSELLVHYAVVLESYEHAEANLPRLTIDVLDENEWPINAGHAHVDIHVPTAKEWEDAESTKDWHVNTFEGDYDYQQHNYLHTVNWLDWRTLRINTADYAGHTLTIQLTTYDCAEGGHFGYAYFMLNCTNSYSEEVVTDLPPANAPQYGAAEESSYDAGYVQKMILNGRLLIRRNGKTYTAQGLEL